MITFKVGLGSMADQNIKINKMALTGFILAMLSIAIFICYFEFRSFYSVLLLVVSALVLPPAALVFSIIGLNLCIKRKEMGKGFAIPGIVFGLLETIIGLCIVLLLLFFARFGGPPRPPQTTPTQSWYTEDVSR